MRKLYAVLAVVCLATAAVAASATAAGSAHFIKHSTSASVSGSDLVCKFKEAGLSAGSTETVTCNATATTTYECINGGNKNPAADNKTVTSTEVSGSGEFTADKNGNISGSLRLSPPSASDLGFSCPPGQRTTFVGVTYSNVSIVDETSGAELALPGTFSN